MKNDNFNITFDRKSGLPSSIVLTKDENKMNWISEIGKWGYIHTYYHALCNPKTEKNPNGMELIEFSEENNVAKAVFCDDRIKVTNENFFDERQNFVQRFTLKNISGSAMFLNETKYGVEIPFNDAYTYADDCITNRCNTHIWCGGNTTYVNALKMGPSENNMGLVVTKGAFNCYSVLNCCDSNCRGRFLLNFEQAELFENEEYVFEWIMFPHTGSENFYKKAINYSSFIHIRAEHYTVFKNEKINFTATTKEPPKNVKVYCKFGDIPFTIEDNVIKVEFLPEQTEEFRVFVEANGKKTWADFDVKIDFENLLKNRIDYIVDKQQYKKEGTSLDGAFLIYDTKKDHIIFDNQWNDHNASRERMGMALLICRYLQTHKNEKYYNALMKNVEFIKREIYDSQTGDVFNTIGKDPSNKRLYNAPWISMYFTELYYLTKDENYLDDILLLLKKYYSVGGTKFYPNGLSPLRTINAFKIAKKEKEYKEVYDMFKEHIGNMVKNKTSYPPHEVNFEQTIVSPATTFISEFAEISKNDNYIEEAKLHVEVLERFSGNQPSCHLNEIPIRYWDDFWFGKFMLKGDTFPHYWSCLSARSYNDYYKISKDKRYLKKAEECMRNCLCLFTNDGKGSAAYIYPYKVNDNFGEIYDDWANDQDFALYFALETGLLEH